MVRGGGWLAADACFLERRPIHGAAVRFEGTVWSVSENGKPFGEVDGPRRRMVR
jgi:hypothetical protein